MCYASSEEEKSSTGLLNCGPYVLQTDLQSNMHTGVIMVWPLRGKPTTLVAFEAVSTKGNPLVCKAVQPLAGDLGPIEKILLVS